MELSEGILWQIAVAFMAAGVSKRFSPFVFGCTLAVQIVARLIIQYFLKGFV